MATLRRLREAPRHLLVCEKSNFGNHKSRHRHLVQTHYYNYRVSFLIPECGILSEELKNLVMNAGPYYFVNNLPLHELITPEFISTFIKKEFYFGPLSAHPQRFLLCTNIQYKY
ncbi:RPP40 isoform 6 [Pongo abelii]|uniref:RPP40 isoform 6 n=1 Tax=Pongo abelii TaxID=9601 RepID=A0A2J8WMQ8_PONAB|nr:RPP40 isoform 6 [Pongo abelii]